MVSFFYFSKLLKILYFIFFFFYLKREHGLHISSPLLQEKASYFNKEIGADEQFKGSEGWLES